MPLVASQQPGGTPDGDQSAAARTAEPVAGPSAGKGRGPGRVADQALQLLSDQVGRQASLLAFSDVFRVVGVLFLLALPLVLLTGGRVRGEGGGGY